VRAQSPATGGKDQQSAQEVRSSYYTGGGKEQQYVQENLYQAYAYPYAGAWSRIKDPGRANGVLSYFSLRDEGAVAGPPKDQGTPRENPSALAEQVRGRPFSICEGKTLICRIDVLRTMIKELDNRGQEKVNPHRLFNEGLGRGGSENSQMSPSADEGGGYSSDGSSRSRIQKTRSRSKSKSVNSKPQSVRGSRRKSSLNSGYDIVSDSSSDELSMPYRRPKPMPFTSRITRFRYHQRAKLTANVRVYEGNKDPKDHLGIFTAAAEQEEWPISVWCKMFRKTLSGSPRNWFDSLDPKSVDGFEELRNKFLEEFSQQKRYDNDPTEIHEIKNKGHRRGQGRSMRTCTPYARKAGFTPLTKTPKEILAMDNVNFPRPPLMVGTPEKQNMNKFYDYHKDQGHNTNDCYHLKKQIEETVASGRLTRLVKDIRQSGQKNKGSAKGKEKVISMVRSQGYQKRPYERVEH
ncbi:hypothetical protein Tco_0599723, partial [Tanacetum coccineum]